MLSFENDAHRTKPTEYFLPTEEIEDYSVIIDGEIFFNQPMKKDLEHMKISEKWNWSRR